MNCICGCGETLGKVQLDANLLAAEVALELLAWDRARALRSPVAAAEVEAAIGAGAPRYQDLLAAIHENAAPNGAEESAHRWLEVSRRSRAEVHERLPAVPKKKVSLSDEESARVDRRHPERSFSGRGGDGEELPSGVPTALELELGSVLQSADDGGEDFESLAVGWLGRLICERKPSLDELRWLLGRLEDARSGRIDEAEPGLRRFLAE